MSEIHRDRELEHLESMLYTYKVENKSMDTENERLRQALGNAQQARVSQGKAIIDANNEIERLREALVKIARGIGDPVMVAYLALGGDNG